MSKLLLLIKVPLFIIAGTFFVLFLAKNFVVIPWYKFIVMALKGLFVMVFFLVCVPFLLFLMCSTDCFAGKAA